MLLSTNAYQTNVGGRQIIVSINLQLEHGTLYVFGVINAFLVSILRGSDLLGCVQSGDEDESSWTAVSVFVTWKCYNNGIEELWLNISAQELL